MNIYCVYLTTYVGHKLPMFYIGSSSVDKVANGYHGSVKSKQYKQIWKDELLNNPHLFKTQIVKTYQTRKEATDAERRLQTKLDVVKSVMYINMAIATKDGFFGRDTSGRNHPQFGMRGSNGVNYGKKRGDEFSTKISEANRGRKCSELTRKRMSVAQTGENSWVYGKKQSEEHVAKRTSGQAGFYLVTWPDGHETTEHNITRFCRENSLHQGHMTNVANGKAKNHKGFGCVRLTASTSHSQS